MVTRWKKWASLLALVLALELLAVGIAGAAAGRLVLAPQGYGVQDAFQEDYRNTAAFRREISSLLRYFLNAGLVDPTGGNWSTAYQDDPNLLYQVGAFDPATGQRAWVSNTGEALSARLPEGYSFKLTFMDGRVSAYLNGEALDVYGDGRYTPDSLWDVPGYRNQTATEAESGVIIYLAVIDSPLKTYYSSPVYNVCQDLALVRRLYTADLAVLGTGLVCLVLAILWRKARREARLSLARRTGKLWLEVKMLLLAVPFLIPFWLDGRHWYSSHGYWCVPFELSAAVLCLLYPWLLYLAANDLRHTEKPWRNSLCWKAVRWTAGPAVLALMERFWFEGKLLVLAGVPFLLFVLYPDLYYYFGSLESILTLAFVLLLCLGYLLFLRMMFHDIQHNGKPWRNSLCCRAFRWAASPKALAFMERLWFEGKLLVLAGVPFLVFTLNPDLFYHFGSLGSILKLMFGVLLCLGYALFLCMMLHDLRRNGKPWRNGLCAKLLGWLSRRFGRVCAFFRSETFKQPLQRRVALRVLVLFALLVLFAAVLGLIALNYLWVYAYSGTSRLAAVGLLMLLGVGLVALAFVLADNELIFARQLAALAEQLSVIRSGALAAPLSLPEGSDLAQAAEDLNGIQQGMRSALEERMKSERMKVELIANVSHDLKTPLTSVISYAELLREEEDLPPHVKDYIRILGDKAHRLQVMVQDVFEVSKAASGELTVRTERLDLSKLLRQTLADMDESIQQSTLAFRSTLPAGPVWIDADGDRLYRVFQNLIQNALQYALEGSRVYVTLDARGGTAVAAVKNTSRDELPPGTDFTARFVRGDSSRSSGGSGLGLAIASSYSAACGGTLRVETDADLFTVLVSFPVVNGSGQ